MENTILIYCREQAGYSVREIASYLRISLSDYEAVEAGERYLRLEQARQLERLFGVETHCLFIAGLQVDVLRCIEELNEMTRKYTLH